MIIIIEDKEGFDKALEEAVDKLVVVDFTATWCGPCQSIAPFFKGLSENYQSLDVASFCDIKCMPTFHFYKNQKKVEEFSGSNQAKLEELVNTHK
ncbi:thioredoxin-like [Oncorhynchus masou masou]|uniref:thioredoxin-like n=1 Tax=Oncorhynchus masou masou TaxID=90313 RepID=UPI0031839BD2